MLTKAKIKVIVVPVSPIDSEHFQEYYEILKKCSTVPVSEITQFQANKYTEQFNQGRVHYEFVLEYDKNVDLQELELHHQVFGVWIIDQVIGLLHCQQVGDLYQGVRKFQQICQRVLKINQYPTATVQRCFGFEPHQDQSDDIKGLIMIPNVGDITFYLSTMIQDFTRDLLVAFGLLAGQLERKTVIQGPILVAPPFLEANSPLKDQNDNSSTAIMASMVNPEKTRKKTPARAQKLLGDLYLLGGRLDLAIEFFASAIEGAKNNGDFPWHASALEGFTCARLLTFVYGAMSEDEDDRILKPLPTAVEIVDLAMKNKELFNWLCEIPERYREIIKLHETSYPYGSLGFYPIFQIHCMLRCAEFLLAAYKTRFPGVFLNSASIAWYTESKSLTAELAARVASTTVALQPLAQNSVTLLPQPSTVQLEKATFQEGKGASKLDVLSWLTRAALCGNEYLTPQDQVYVLSSIAALCGRLGAFRKHGFYLRLVATAAHQMGNKSTPLSKRYTIDSNPSLSCMRRVCKLLECGDQPAVPDDHRWLERYYSSDANHTVEYGWPSLRIGVYKEAIQIAEVSQDYVNSLLFTAEMLRKLYYYLSRKDQAHYSEMLQKVVMYHRKQSLKQPLNNSSIFPLIRGGHGIFLGVPVVKKMEIIKPMSRYMVTHHQPKSKSDAKSTFLYSPFAKKDNKEKKILYAANELIAVDVTLANPFLFDIDVQMMSLVGTGGSFKPSSISTLIPAESTSHTVRLLCVPNAEGVVEITGVTARMIGGCLEEFLVPLEQYKSDPTLFTKDGVFRKQLEQQKYGTPKASQQRTPVESSKWTLPIHVIPPQPTLELLETSLGSQKAITLFEGERSSISFTIRNVGNTPINYLFMRIQEQRWTRENEDSYEADVYLSSVKAFYPLVDELPEVPVALSADQGLVTKMTFCGELSPLKLDTSLAPGEQLVIQLGVFGKRDWYLNLI
jgi:tetratricopeptide (TPR) repeat protein